MMSGVGELKGPKLKRFEVTFESTKIIAAPDEETAGLIFFQKLMEELADVEYSILDLDVREIDGREILDHYVKVYGELEHSTDGCLDCVMCVNLEECRKAGRAICEKFIIDEIGYYIDDTGEVAFDKCWLLVVKDRAMQRLLGFEIAAMRKSWGL